MADLARTLARKVLMQVDRWYGRRFRLRSVGSVLLLGCRPYAGTARVFSDGTHLAPPQRIGVLHFHNLRIAALAAPSRQHAGVRFARLFRQSLQALAMQAQANPELQDVSVYQGLTWFRPHGRKVGFFSEALPKGLRSWWLRTYFRVLVWGFSPVTAASAQVRAPRRFWITRGDLIRHFGSKPPDHGDA